MQSTQLFRASCVLHVLLLECFMWSYSRSLPSLYSQNRRFDFLRKGLGDDRKSWNQNPEENRGVKGVHLIDGDILVHVETRSGQPQTNHEALSFAQNYAPTSTLKKNVNKNRNWMWTKRVIPYVIDSAYSGDVEMKNEILHAMQEFHSQTCVRFKPRQSEMDYVNIVPLNGCYSSVGRQGGMQNLSLSDECRTRGTIMHELMHSLGFWHEQSRWDRDDYVRIDFDNVLGVHVMNFQKYPVTKQSTLGAPYDYGSILHYKANAFAKDSSMPTIIPLSNDPVAALEMGQRKRLSPIDIYKINTLYHCNITRCGDPGLPEHGFRQGDSFDVGATMTYSCRQGFTLIGSHQRYCMDNGEWTSYPPSCVAGKINYCDFEDKGLCGWTQDNTDDVDWIRHHAGTVSDQTGPNDDNTMKTTEGHYMYLEASTPTQRGDKARLISPAIQPFAKRMCLNSIHLFRYTRTDTVRTSIICMIDGKAHLGDHGCQFYYSMYGQGMGSLKVIQREAGQRDYSLFTISGDKGQYWHEEEIALKPLGEFKVVFEATRGSNYLSDIAIDDVIVADCNALTDNVLNIPEESTLPKTLYCDFETSLCGFQIKKGDGFSINIGPTLTSLTGPPCDHTTCNDLSNNLNNLNFLIPTTESRYIYFEASSPRTPGDSARVISPELDGVGTKCSTFYYSMYGSTMGTLNVYLNEGQHSFLIWSKSGDQGAGWHRAQVEFRPTGRFSISYEAVRGSSYRSDIGIDDLSVTNGPCINLLSNDAAYSDTSAIGRLSCGFETDLCGWQEYVGGNFNWARNHGITSTPWTGPVGDHTPGLNGDGMYIYVEATSQQPGHIARMESPLLPVDGDGYCFTFWYHMIGQHIGALRVIKATVTGLTETIWQRQGQQLPDGYNHTIAYNTTALREMWIEGNAYINSDVPFRIYIEGEIGGSYRGDIAVDDVSLQESDDASCHTS